MTNKNSIEAYREEVDNGNISNRQQQVIDWLKVNHYGTARQIGEAVPGAWRRCSELLAMGKITRTKDVICPVTNKKVARFALPNFADKMTPLFINTIKKPTRKQLIDRINELEMELAYKNSEIAQAYNDGIRFARTMRPVKRIWFKFW